MARGESRYAAIRFSNDRDDGGYLTELLETTENLFRCRWVAELRE
jgi:hypothetical protein